ncbi:MAG: hypothetical protein NTW46_01980 [Candidatus Nealsonbacteria bacterium]|nr:hypothetical protein [Candidatus Nealsonbacteria bacterium]
MTNKGTALLYTILLLSILLTVVLGLSTLISSQFEIMKGTGNSVIAFYAADAGIERMLACIVANNEPLTGNEFTSVLGDFSNGASYSVKIFCRNGADGCGGPGEIPYPPSGEVCDADNYCIKSIGTYKDTKRALMVTI